MKTRLVLLLSAGTICMLSACSTMLVSPLGTTSSPYIPMPSVTGPDSSKIVTYAAATVSAGTPMESRGYDDWDLYFGGMIGQGVAVGHFRARYDISLASGVYVATKEKFGETDIAEVNYRNGHGGSLHTGMIGTHGGFCFASQFKQGKIEWRIIGLEGSISKEFGEYVRFREKYPGDRYDRVETRDWQYSLGLFSEFVRFGKRNRYFGMKYAISAGTLGAILAAPISAELKVDNTAGLPQYFAVTAFMGNQRLSGYWQLNFGPLYHMNLGILFRLRKQQNPGQ